MSPLDSKVPQALEDKGPRDSCSVEGHAESFDLLPAFQVRDLASVRGLFLVFAGLVALVSGGLFLCFLVLGGWEARLFTGGLALLGLYASHKTTHSILRWKAERTLGSQKEC